MVLTEGMQYGCTPMTFNNYGAVYEIADDGRNGCLISTFSLKHYRNRLVELMSEDKNHNVMLVDSKEKEEEFSVENVVNKWEDPLLIRENNQKHIGLFCFLFPFVFVVGGFV